jgi:hypothetical protein
MSAVSAKNWQPVKHPSLYDLDAVRKTPIYQGLVNLYPDLPPSAVADLAKQAIIAKWEKNQVEHRQTVIQEIDKMLADLGMDAAVIQIDRNALTLEEIWPKSKRWRPIDYVPFIDRSFSRTSQSHDPLRRGTYTLYINKPLSGSKQQISAKLVCPRRFELRFPPRNPKNPKKGRNYEEVTSMSALLRKCPLRSALSPAQYFDLGEPPEREAD